VVKDISAGVCGGIMVTLVGHPFDTLKVLLQTQPVNNTQYSSLADCFRKTWQQEQLRGLYKGVSSPLLLQVLFRATLFMSYGQAKLWVDCSGDKPLSFMLAGTLGWFFPSFVEGPIDFYKTQLQAELLRARMSTSYTPCYRNLYDLIRQSVVQNGFRGPFQGLTAVQVRNIPGGAVYFGTFENVKHWLATRNGGVLKVWHVCAAGSSAGLMFWIPFFPFDVIKSEVMSDSIRRKVRRYKHWGDCVKQLYGQGGILRFYRGLTPCVIRAIPANAVMLYTVHAVRVQLGLPD
jgi:solute carrier family 25 carnitine/acylcarnitine transporter 20/29